MAFGRSTPGLCPICGAAHTACTAGQGPITAVQLPARDASVARALADPLLEPAAAPADEAEPVSPASHGDGRDGRPFSTATYRGKKKAGPAAAR